MNKVIELQLPVSELIIAENQKKIEEYLNDTKPVSYNDYEWVKIVDEDTDESIFVGMCRDKNIINRFEKNGALVQDGTGISNEKVNLGSYCITPTSHFDTYATGVVWDCDDDKYVNVKIAYKQVSGTTLVFANYGRYIVYGFYEILEPYFENITNVYSIYVVLNYDLAQLPELIDYYDLCKDPEKYEDIVEFDEFGSNAG